MRANTGNGGDVKITGDPKVSLQWKIEQWLTENPDCTFRADDFVIIHRGAFGSQSGAKFEAEEIVYGTGIL